MESRLLKTDEVADILQVSRSFAYQLMKRGENTLSPDWQRCAGQI
jgi:predicted DNA-binding transcriptional regulator AlpA